MGTIINAITKLRNDEHIDTAIKTNIIRNAFLLTYEGLSDSPLSIEEEEFNVKYMESLMRGIYDLNKPVRPFTYPLSDIHNS